MPLNEFRVFGPPGTGKTTYLSRQVAAAVDRHGPEAVMVTSFTKTAAREIAARDLPIPDEQVGTLHAFCYRGLGRPELAQKHIKEWNEVYPTWKIKSGLKINLDEPEDVDGEGYDNGDKALRDTQIYRARMIPEEKWPVHTRGFHHLWSDWKVENSYQDFTDLIDNGRLMLSRPPNDASILFVDEAQDLTALQLDLVRRWAHNMDRVVLVGDDDQCIYSFAGATPDAFLQPPLDDDRKRFLRKSYRLPSAVKNLAHRIIQPVRYREPKEFEPRDETGNVWPYFRARWKFPETIVAQILNEHLPKNQTVMILAACTFQLRPIVKNLRLFGIPFHNPYRRRRRDWNPLGGLNRSDDVLSTPRAFKAFMRADFRAVDLYHFASVLKQRGALVHGQGAKILDALSEKVAGRDTEVYQSASGLLPAVIDEQAMGYVLNHDLNWFVDHLQTPRQNAGKFCRQVVNRLGIDALTKEPQVTVGTIHSVKGGEADVVYIFPDLSPEGYREFVSSQHGADATRRQFYVGVTRARHEVRICCASGTMNFPL